MLSRVKNIHLTIDYDVHKSLKAKALYKNITLKELLISLLVEKSNKPLIAKDVEKVADL
ncbi:hypothetical protein AB9G23_09755 [Francisella philomiragia]|uniref:hypothetical protein n=1 Tax=Francisella philomiragia TaxID=28110 RepID=UPI001904225E|nr:hypothetical protein [Francisella philomiragia]MBK2025590.1 hypothetical protein [Francisella philomiragia]